MKTEYEVRVLEIDQNELINKLEQFGALKKGEFNQKRYVYDLNPRENGKWIRLRTNGNVTTLCYKNVVSNTIDGTKEIEFIVEDFNTTNEFLEKIGFIHRNYQENRRLQYILDGIEIDIDTWPLIPTYLEIEGNSEQEVLNMIDRLGLNDKKVTSLNCEDIYKDIYGINVLDIKDLKF